MVTMDSHSRTVNRLWSKYSGGSCTTKRTGKNGSYPSITGECSRTIHRVDGKQNRYCRYCINCCEYMHSNFFVFTCLCGIPQRSRISCRIQPNYRCGNNISESFPETAVSQINGIDGKNYPGQYPVESRKKRCGGCCIHGGTDPYHCAQYHDQQFP